MLSFLMGCIAAACIFWLVLENRLKKANKAEKQYRTSIRDVDRHYRKLVSREKELVDGTLVLKRENERLRSKNSQHRAFNLRVGAATEQLQQLLAECRKIEFGHSGSFQILSRYLDNIEVTINDLLDHYSTEDEKTLVMSRTGDKTIEALAEVERTSE